LRLFDFADEAKQHFINEKGKLRGLPFLNSGAGEESRTLDLNLGKVALYQLSYSRINQEALL
jgi:hypothetical protein